MKKRSKLIKKLILVSFLVINVSFISLQYNGLKSERSKWDKPIINTLDDLKASKPVEYQQYQYFKRITIDHNQISGRTDFVDFPVLISLSDADLRTKTQTNGDDIAFALGDTWLDYEIEFFDQLGNGTHANLVAWVNIPTLTANSDTEILMYYGNSTAISKANPSGVWDNDFVSVFHLNETPSGSSDEIKDSSSNVNHGTTSGSMDSSDLINGKIGKGLNLDGIDDIITVSDSPSLDSTNDGGTISLWLNWVDSSDGDYQRIMTTSNKFEGGGLDDGYELAVQGDGDLYFYPRGNDGNNYNLDTNPFSNGIWQNLVITYDYTATDAILYLDGVELSLTTNNIPTYWVGLATLDDWLWGGVINRAGFFAGMFDEIRVADVERSNDWIATEFSNQNNPNSFYSVGSNEKVVTFNDFQYYKDITINSSLVSGSGNLTSFPVLFSFEDTELHTDVQYDGDDIAFSIGSSWLNHEIESFEQDFTPTTARLITWVNIPELSPSEDIVVRMYYGNSTIGSQSNQGVFDKNYIGIWHFNEDPAGTVLDSSIYGNDGISLGSMNSNDLVEGQIGKSFDLDGNNDYIRVNNDISLDITSSITMQSWIKTPIADWDVLMSKGYYSDAYSCYLYTSNDFYYYLSGAGDQTNTFQTVGDDIWTHLAFTWDGSTAKVFRNGIEIFSNSQSGTIPTNGEYLFIGSMSAGDQLLGVMDEVRLSDISRDEDWLITEYQNQFDPANFFTVGTARINGIPVININSPGPYEILPYSAPKFNIQILNVEFLDNMWYSLDDGLTNFEFTVNGTIEQSEWEKFGEELVTIKFYANNTDGDKSFQEVTVRKKSISSFIDYAAYKTITIDQTEVSGVGNHINFPMLISIFDVDLHNDVQPNAADIAFGNATQWFNHEIEMFNQNFNETHAQLIAWVRIPTLSTTSDTEIKMFFGNSTKTAENYPSGVWSANYEGIWHLNNDPGPGIMNDIKDSTANNNDGTADSSMLTNDLNTSFPGGLNFDGGDDHVEIGSIENEINSISFWMKANNLNGLSTDTGFKSPNSYSEDYSQWANPEYALISNGQYSRTPANDYQNDWYDFSFGLPNGINTGVDIIGIEVRVEGNSQNMETGVSVELSWDGGLSYTTTGYSHYWTGISDYYFSFGGSVDNWGHDWTATDLHDQNFRIKLNKIQNGGAGNMFYLDHLEIKVFYSVNEKILDFNGATRLEINQSNSNIMKTNFIGPSLTYINGTISESVDDQWNYITITNTAGIDATALNIAKYGNFYFNGSIDELRLSNDIKSLEWIETEFSNYIDPQNFYTVGIRVKTYCDVQILCVDSEGYEIENLNIKILNASNVGNWENIANQSQLTDQFGFATFEKLIPDLYTINITYGQQYGKKLHLKEFNVSITDDSFLIINDLNLSSIDLTLVFKDDPEQPVYNAEISFYEINATGGFEFIGTQISDIFGKATFTWLNLSSSIVNYTFNVQKLGSLQLINNTDFLLDSYYLNFTLEVHNAMTVGVALEEFTTYLDFEFTTQILMDQNYWGEIVTINISYGWQISSNGTKYPISAADVTYQLKFEGSNEIITFGNFDENGTGGYGIELDSMILGLNASDFSYTLDIFADKPGYDDLSTSLIIKLRDIPVSITPENNIDSFIIYWTENISINLQLYDILHDLEIDDALLIFEEKLEERIQGNLVRNLSLGAGWYSLNLNSTDLINLGSYIFTIQLESNRYFANGSDIYLTVLGLPLQITPEGDINNFELFWLENITFNIMIEDSHYNTWINDATVTFEEKFNSFVFGTMSRNISKGNGWYYFSIKTCDLPKFGTYSILIHAQKNNYIDEIIEIQLNVLQIHTLINGTLFLPVPITINVTTEHEFFFKYTDEELNPITDAEILGWELQNLANVSDIRSGILENTSYPGVYKISNLNTSDYEIGTYSIIIRISKSNYVTRQAAISLVVEPIPLKIVGVNSYYSNPKGQNITISISLINPLSNLPLSGEIVRITYGGDEHIMLENETSGGYYWIIDSNNYNVLAFSETFEVLIIIASISNYTVENIVFTVEILPPLGPLNIPLVYWIIIGSVGIAAIGIFVTARIVIYSNIPLMVKQINTTSKSIKKDRKFRNPNMIHNRNQMIKEHMKERYNLVNFTPINKKKSTDKNSDKHAKTKNG